MVLKIVALFLLLQIHEDFGKEVASPGEFPWTVSLRLSGFLGHDCGAAILNENWVLATGYCAELNDDIDHPNFLVVAGEHNLNQEEETEQIRHVEKAFIHPYFGPEQGSDIALLKLDSPLEFNEFVKGIALPTNLEALESSFTDCIESGWSQQDAKLVLQKAPLTLIDTEVCQEQADDGDKVPSTSFCGGNENGATEMCPGYTGSPVVCSEGNDRVLVGLQSFNWVCNTANSPGVYTSIRAMRDWIEYVLEANA